MKRRRFDVEFKARVALEAVRGNLTIADLSNKYSVGLTQIKEWKAALLANVSAVFAKDAKPVRDRKVGQQAIHIDFLKKIY